MKMAGQLVISLSLLILLYVTSCVTSRSTPESNYGNHLRVRDFIEGQCQVTRYSQLCLQSLSNSATPQNPKQFAQMALSVGLVRAQSTKAYVTRVAEEMKDTKAKEYPIVKDCLEQIKDGVDRISQSIKELKHIDDEDGDDSFVWQVRNVQTWLSAAMTDATVCIDGFSGDTIGGKTKATIKANVLNVAQVTSNALTLFNRFAARHLARGATTKP